MKGSFLKCSAVKTVRDIASVYTKNHVPRSAAALSYSLTLSIFPVLICIGAILGSLHLSVNFLEGWENIIPAGAHTLINDFLNYVGESASELMLVIGIGVMITSSSAAFRTITGIFGDIQGARRFTGVFGTLFSFILSVAFLIVIYLSGLIIASGGWLLQFLERYFSFGGILALWQWLRFAILFLLMFGVIYALYLISAPRSTRRVQRLPGALISSVALVGVSIVFSRMISESVKYTIVYGTLASFIILLVWLYICSMILILGNVFNIVRSPDWRERS